ncbi:MAG: LacI family DNA-binding transcriptional regulator [Sphaerochaetaceae bacterium]
MTITDIARIANVSIGTVDRVLHKRGRVAPKTAEKILSIIEEYGYQPNTYARNLKLSKQFTIGVLLPLLHSEYGYWNLMYEGILKAAKELAPLAVNIDMLEFDRTKKGSLLQQSKRLLEKSVDALLMAPVVPDEAKILLTDHPSLDYAFIDSPLPDTNPICSVIQNPYKGGFLAGRMMHLLQPKGGSLLVVQTHRAAYNSSERARGFFSYFADKQEYQAYDMEVRFGDQYTIGMLDAFYRNHPDMQGIFVVNDAIHRIAEMVVLLGRKSQTVMIGYDAIEQNRKAMKNKQVDCLLSQRPEFQGYTAIYQLYRKGLLSQIPESTISVPIDIILPENLVDA